MSDSVEDEPVFSTPDCFDVSDDNGIWGEPSAESNPAADAEMRRRTEWLDRQWEEGIRSGGSALWFLGICLASGFFAIICAVFREAGSGGATAVFLFAPACEEIAKIAIPLMTLEKRPWTFHYPSQIVVSCLLSGLIFATIENILYFVVYIPHEELTDGIVAWRLCVCTALHITGAAISSAGLVAGWRAAKKTRGTFNFRTALPYIIAAMTIHGIYNLSMLFVAGL